ncbi:Cytochrome B [Candidatus Desulfarcum epimagneticum]|uniref:Cytochrome B n=1 Tax=uncultured Desulfobacteraceae bacterium TaxID=218296 RepID=A0A484HKG7_9BACT|nr:Cytochrome B [uncultured Desulfobacteraceae bacterium]
MENKKMTHLYLYSRYERFWHWLQSLLILILLATGLEVKGVFTLFGFHSAVKIHNFTGLSWLVAFAFFVFWIFTTGEWRQYVPTTRKMLSVCRYYALGIFRGEDHPVPKRKEAKHNPLQRLIYLGLAALLLPIQMITGFLYWGYNSWAEWGLDGALSLKVLATVHVAGSFAILSFLIVHLYMITTGHSLGSHAKAMITGWESVEEGEKIEDWEKARAAR